MTQGISVKKRVLEKLVIEPTTRCNFKCNMCVKQSKGCQIPEGDMSESVFLKCTPLFPNLSSIIFTGIGEPLLHPDLDSYIRQAAELMPANSQIGFQTNGKLLTRDRAVSLVESGLTRICLSVDTVMPDLFGQVRNGGTLKDIDMALQALDHARHQVPDNRLVVGIEFVLMNENLAELPHLVRWAGEQGIDFILVTHLTAYEKDLETEQVHLNNSRKARDLFNSYRAKAAGKNLDLTSYSPKMVKFYQTKKEQQLCELVSELKETALKQGLYVNLFQLLAEKDGEYERIRHVFDQALAVADTYKISLTLPRIRPRKDRYCPFVEENTAFVTWQGLVSPCYFLWHQYTTQRSGDTKHVDPVYFGSVMDRSLESIWNKDKFVQFRQTVKKYDYPDCNGWCEQRCDYVLEAPFFQDCHINDVPCGDCQWNLGFLNCLS